MRLNSSKMLLGIIILLVASGGYGFSCKSTGNVNTDSKLRTLARTEDDIGQGLKSTAKVLKDTEAEGTLSKEDLAVLKPILKTVGESNLQAIEITKSINKLGELPADKQKQLLAIVSFASDQLVQLNEEGTLRIKNPTKKLLFTTIVVTLQSSVTSLVPLLVKGNQE